VKRVQYLHQKLKDAVLSKAPASTAAGDLNQKIKETSIIKKQPKPKDSSMQNVSVTSLIEIKTESSSCDNSEGQVDASFRPTRKLECKETSLESYSYEQTNPTFCENVSVWKDVSLDSKQKSLKSAAENANQGMVNMKVDNANRGMVNMKVDIASLFTQEFEENYQPIDLKQKTPRQPTDEAKRKTNDK